MRAGHSLFARARLALWGVFSLGDNGFGWGWPRLSAVVGFAVEGWLVGADPVSKRRRYGGSGGGVCDTWVPSNAGQ
ncbi:hypothetical protein Aglo01_55950 [Actinokineospora globicatena]|nr:hypothetical protein Aglo01_55950 [Actinokineospora globicatena]GLW88307.1 hypothetical protein Aglo02_59460 [Actinokineospora globicatena]